MIFQVYGSNGNEYCVDSDKVTCTCPDFIYRRSFNKIYSPNRLCKHLVKIYSDHPEIKPSEVPFSNEKLEYDTEKFPINRDEISSYVKLAKYALSMYGDKISYSQIGDYVLGKDEIRDGVRFFISTEVPFEKVSEKFRYMTFSEESYCGEDRSSFSIGRRINFDIINVPINELYTRSLFHNSGKKEILRLINSAYCLGYELSLHGITGKDGNQIIPKSEEDIYELLGEQYKPPKERLP